MPQLLRTFAEPAAMLMVLLAVAGCRRSTVAPQSAETTPVETRPNESPSEATSTPVVTKTTPASEARPRANLPPPPAEIWKEFSGEKAMAEVEKQVAFGARPAGSVELLGARKAIVASLQASGWATELQEFNDT